MSNIVIDSLEKYKKFISSNNEEKINILIHACCAPCSSEVLDQLNKVCNITIYYYNPNTYPYEEYLKRYAQEINETVERNQKLRNELREKTRIAQENSTINQAIKNCQPDWELYLSLEDSNTSQKNFKLSLILK